MNKLQAARRETHFPGAGWDACAWTCAWPSISQYFTSCHYRWLCGSLCSLLFARGFCGHLGAWLVLRTCCRQDASPTPQSTFWLSFNLFICRAAVWPVACLKNVSGRNIFFDLRHDCRGGVELQRADSLTTNNAARALMQHCHLEQLRIWSFYRGSRYRPETQVPNFSIMALTSYHWWSTNCDLRSDS